MKLTILLLTTFVLLGCENEKKTQEIYSAWVKAHKSDLTLAEWSTLREAKLLPGQPDNSAANRAAAMSGAAMGMSAGQAAGRR